MENLLKTSKLMREQDFRATQYPLFVIQDKVRRWHTQPHCMDDTISERKEDHDEKELCQKCKKRYQSNEDLPDACEDCDYECFAYFKREWEFDINAGVFFTEEACHAHLEANRHHYTKKARSYVISAWRNPEMVAVMQSILKLTGDIPSQYK